jgi:beta-lactamase superfamily II metal-dependent hydrolase
MCRSVFTILAFVAMQAFAQANGNLQLHFMHVGQGDGAVLISPLGEVVLFDNGVRKFCDLPVSYLQQLGVTKVDYHITSHYHDDHIGCTAEVLGEFPLQKFAYDRDGTYKTKTFQTYLATIGAKRRAASEGDSITLDAGSANPVTITFAALNGNGIDTDNENDRSLVALVDFGDFEAEISGDLSGYDTSSYKDIETSVAPKVGQIEVYKVHHHGSSHSTNDDWLAVTKPRVAIISAGEGNSYGHPTMDSLERLHQASVKTYWTSTGSGDVDPEPLFDVVSGNTIVEVAPGAAEFTVLREDGVTDRYPFSAGMAPLAAPSVTYAWSKRSGVYHFSTCKYVQNISSHNLMQGTTPPAGKRLHTDCPR